MSLIPLTDIQISDLAEFIRHQRHMNLSDPGTRKTAVTNVMCQYIWTEFQQRTLFLMPLSLFDQNFESFFKFTNFTPDDIVILRGTPEKRKKLMATDAKVFIASFNFFVPDKNGISDYERLRQCHPDVNFLAVDEIHLGFRSMTAKRTLAFVGAMQQRSTMCQWFLPMTGTPVDGRLDTIYPMLTIIEPRYYYNYRVFLQEHAIYDLWGRIVGWKNSDKLKQIIAKHSVKHSFEEVHGPASIEIIHQPINMTDKHREMYNDYANTNTLDLENEIKVATHEAEAVIRLRQICNCPEVLGLDIPDLEKDAMMEVHFSAALEAKKAMVVFSAHVAEQERLMELAKHCGVRAALINGSVPSVQRSKITVSFQRGELDCIVASPATVAVGYDWSHVDYMVFTSMDYKDSSFVQGYHRAVRGKRERPLLVYVLYYARSVEEDILSTMEGKMSLAHSTDETRVKYQLRKRRKTNDKLEQMRESMQNQKQIKFS